MTQRLRDFLASLNRRNWAYNPDLEIEPNEPPFSPILADDWQEFKRKFVEEYGGEKVRQDGMTHREFLRYLKDGYREGDEYNEDTEWW